MIRMVDKDGRCTVVTTKRQVNGLYSVTTTHYDHSGYYIPGATFTRDNSTLEEIEEFKVAAGRLGSKVTTY